MFDFERWLTQRGIPFFTTGANVSTGNIVIQCPMCGSADEGQHMAISTEGRGWRCFRNKEHSGKNPARLIMALLGVSFAEAQRMVGDDVFVPTNFLERVHAMMSPPAVEGTGRVLAIPPEFKALSYDKPSAKPYLRYLEGRKFTRAQIETFTKRYQMYYATKGPYRGRVIFAVYQDKALVSWTGRTIGSHPVRYRTLSDDPERAHNEGSEPAMAPLPNFLLWYDQLKRIDADTIYLVEGPFDALKVNVLGRPYGLCATCFFTATPSTWQVDLMHDLLPRFKHRRLLLDRGTLVNALKTSGVLSSLRVGIDNIPPGIKDPGELSLRQLLALAPPD